MKTIFSVLLILIFTQTISFGQDFIEGFNMLAGKDSTLAEQSELLRQWDIAKPEEADRFGAYFNYYLTLAQKEYQSTDSGNNNCYTYLLEGAKGKKEASFCIRVLLKASLLSSGFRYLDSGITKFPDRLDLRLGKSYMLLSTENYPAFIEELNAIFREAKRNKDTWYWERDEKLHTPMLILYQSIQSYILQMMERDKSVAPYIRQTAELGLKYYPKEIDLYSNLSSSFMIEGKAKDALKIMLKAEKLEPANAMVLNNIAHIYLKMNNKKKAISYYEKIVKKCDRIAARKAQNQLDFLKNH